MRHAAMVVIAGLLAGCSGAPQEPVLVMVDPEPPRVAPECTTADPVWAEPPEADLRRSEVARLWRTNKDRFAAIRAARRICRASIKAQAKG